MPRVAVIQRKGQAMVVGVDDGHARIRPIEIGAMVREGYVEVLSGLTVGEEIVIFGQDQLEDGDPVNPNWREWAHRTPPELAASGTSN